MSNINKYENTIRFLESEVKQCFDGLEMVNSYISHDGLHSMPIETIQRYAKEFGTRIEEINSCLMELGQARLNKE